MKKDSYSLIRKEQSLLLWKAYALLAVKLSSLLLLSSTTWLFLGFSFGIFDKTHSFIASLGIWVVSVILYFGIKVYHKIFRKERIIRTDRDWEHMQRH